MQTKKEVISAKQETMDVVKSPNPGILSTVAEYKGVTLSLSTAGTVTMVSSIPVIHGAFTAPLVSISVREGMLYLLSASSKPFLEAVAIKYLAETTAVNIIAQGYAPYVLGAVSGGSILACYTVASGCYYTYKLTKWAYNNHYNIADNKQLAIESGSLALAYPAIEYPDYEHPSRQDEVVDKNEFFISRARLEIIVNDYQTQSKTRSCLSFFKVISSQSNEVCLIKLYLQNNPDLEYISLEKLAETIAAGKPSRIEALMKKAKLVTIETDNQPQGGTDKCIDSIIDSSITGELKNCLEILGISICHDNKMPSQDTLDKAYRAQALVCHPDRKDGSEELFDRLVKAKNNLEHLLGYDEDKSESSMSRDSLIM